MGTIIKTIGSGYQQYFVILIGWNQLLIFVTLEILFNARRILQGSNPDNLDVFAYRENLDSFSFLFFSFFGHHSMLSAMC